MFNPCETTGGSRLEVAGLRTGTAPNRTGQRLYYELSESAGHGHARFVFINNFFMTARQWRPFVEELRADAPVLTYDLRGQGSSARVDEVVSLEQHAEDLYDLLMALKLSDVVLVGTCISTVVASQFALRHGELLSGLVLVGSVLNPFGDKLHHFLHRSLLNSLRVSGPEGLFDHYYPLLYTAHSVQTAGTAGYLVAKSRFVHNNPARQLELNLESSTRLRFPPTRLREIQTPTLFLSGADDFLTRPAASELVAQSMPNARCCVVPHAGHNVYIESPSEFQRQLAIFASGLSSPERHAQA